MTAFTRQAKVAAAIIAFASALTVIPAQAGTADTISFAIDRADLTTPAGAASVYKTLERKAETACRANETFVSLGRRIAAKKCAKALTKDFVRQVNSQHVTALHMTHTASSD